MSEDRRVQEQNRDLGRFFGTALGAAAITYLAARAAPALHIDPRVGFAIAFLAVALEILALAALAPRFTPRLASACALAGLAVVGTLAALAAPAMAWSAGALALGLGLAATAVGAFLGARIEQPGQLAAVALVSAAADLWSVFDPKAPSARFAEEALAEPERLALFALPFPLFGTPILAPVIGVGDLVFTALYVAAFRRHALDRRALLAGLAVAYALALVALLVFLRPLPLLPLLGAAALAVDRRARSLSAREWRTVAIVCGALLVAVALLRTR